jgi:putative ABC transport system substrate-binding protein
MPRQKIPVVMAATGDPLGVGIVAGLAHPGGNVTGLSAFTTELELKRVELLREVVQSLTRLAALYNMSNPVSVPRWEAIRMVARSIGIEAQLLDVRNPEDLAPAFEVAARQRADALIVAEICQAPTRGITAGPCA